MNQTFLIILGMAAVTYGTRAALLLGGSRLALPPRVIAALRFLPVALLSALIAPALLLHNGALALSWQNEYAWGGLICALVAWHTRNTMLTVAAGLAFVVAWRLIVR